MSHTTRIVPKTGKTLNCKKSPISQAAKYPTGDWKWRPIESYRLEELDPAVLKPMLEKYEVAYGEGSWNYYRDDYAKAVERRWNELSFFTGPI